MSTSHSIQLALFIQTLVEVKIKLLKIKKYIVYMVCVEAVQTFDLWFNFIENHSY